MKTVNIGELKNHLSSHLQHVCNGEEVVIRDRDVPIARILPFHHGPDWDREAHLVATGVLKMPEREGGIDWDAFFAKPVGNLSYEAAVRTAIESRGDR